MNAPTEGCDHGRIDDFLNSDHVGLEDEQLMAHLNSCDSCREYLETQAADPDSWSNAAELLRRGEFDQAGAVEYSVATIGHQQIGRPIAIQTVLDSLSPSDDPHRLGRLGGHEVSGVVGAGGMGVVLKAIDPSLDRVVAIKVMAPHLANKATARKRFSREAKAAAAVLHPNVIPIHCVSSDDAIPYLVMAYIRGGSLQKRLEQEGPLPTVEILRIGSQIAAGLAAAHEQGLVHRDIKPENILLEEGVERVTLTDFGLARAVDDASVTRDGTIAGTPQYMSPEQARGESVDQQSDLFSLGSVLYALCTGRPPFRADSSYGVMRRITDSAPTPIRELNSDIPDWLAGIIDKLMAKQKVDRFESASDVHELLEACLNHVQQPAATQLPQQLLTETKPIAKASRRRTFAALILVGAILSMLAAIVFYLQTNHGIVRVEVLDKSLKVALDNQVITIADGNNQPIKLTPGRHKLVVSQSDTEFLSKSFEIRRQGQIAFKAELFKGEVVVTKNGETFGARKLPGNLEPLVKTNKETHRKLSATALANGCEVRGGFTTEQAELVVKNPTGEAKEVSFFFQVVYQNSRDRDDIFQLTGGIFAETVPPGREVRKRVDILLDPNVSMPANYLKDLLVIRVSQDRLKELSDIPIDANRKMDIADRPVAIASQPTRDYAEQTSGPFGKFRSNAPFPLTPSESTRKSEESEAKGQDLNSEPKPRDGDGVGVTPLKPATGRYVKIDHGYMVPYRETIPGSDVTFEMVPVPGGVYRLKPQDDSTNPTYPIPIEVKIDPFWIGRYEVTWAEYHQYCAILDAFKRFERLGIRKVTSENQKDAVTIPSVLYDAALYYPKVADKKDWPRHPATAMTQYAARQYTKWLSKLTGEFYRLPSDVEWEYACRAGSTTLYSFGDEAEQLGNHAWYKHNSDQDTHPVGLKKPNKWGIYDLHANVSEWVLDQFSEKYVGLRMAIAADRQPVHWPTRPHALTVRGGSWDSLPEDCRSVARVGSTVAWQELDFQLPPDPHWLASDIQRKIGFRIARPLNLPPAESQGKYWNANVRKLREAVIEYTSNGYSCWGLVDPDLPSAIHQLDK